MPESVLGRKIHDMRILRGLSMNALAREIGISSSYVSDLENGNSSQPTKDVILALCKTLKVEPIYLLDDKVDSPLAVFDKAEEPLPEKVREWFRKQDPMPWITLSEEAQLENLDAEDLRDLLRVFTKAMKEGKSRRKR